MIWASRAKQLLQVITWAFEALSRDADMNPTHFVLLAAQGQISGANRFHIAGFSG
jgi:hypothetical protein